MLELWDGHTFTVTVDDAEAAVRVIKDRLRSGAGAERTDAPTRDLSWAVSSSGERLSTRSTVTRSRAVPWRSRSHRRSSSRRRASDVVPGRLVGQADGPWPCPPAVPPPDRHRGEAQRVAQVGDGRQRRQRGPAVSTTGVGRGRRHRAYSIQQSSAPADHADDALLGRLLQGRRVGCRRTASTGRRRAQLTEAARARAQDGRPREVAASCHSSTRSAPSRPSTGR